ncbi:MAG TPA: hypothetical protein VF483_10605 [Gemmatimonadaceae bacterium]
MLSVEALLEWDAHMESVLRGVAHALNNRAASMSALMALVVEPDYTPQTTRAMLSTEVDRLHEIVGVVRAVGAPKGDAEAFEPVEAARAASAVLSLHAALRDRKVLINAVAPPVRACRWMFVRALVVLAGRAALVERKSAVTIDINEVDGWVHATASAAPPGSRSAYLEEIAVALGGEPLVESSGFRMPTLATLRRREGR